MLTKRASRERQRNPRQIQTRDCDSDVSAGNGGKKLKQNYCVYDSLYPNCAYALVDKLKHYLLAFLLEAT